MAAEAGRTPRRVLCVCTGNTCRSPMLAALLAHHARRAGREWTVASAGTAAAAGEPASAHARTAMAARGLDLAGHRATPVDRLDPRAYDAVLAVSARHAARLAELGFPAERITVVNADRGGVPDPFGGDLAEYQGCAQVLERAVLDFLARNPS